MEKKSRKDLLIVIEEQNKSLTKYKERLRDLIESYKHLVKEKEALEFSIKTLTAADSLLSSEQENLHRPNTEVDDAESKDVAKEKKAETECLQMLKSSFATLAAEKSRTENELRADRKKLLLEKEEVESNLNQKQNEWFQQKERFENQMQDMKKKINTQQQEREKEQQDHSLMLKELQNLLANERANKEKLDQQVYDWHRFEKSKLTEKKSLEYGKHIEILKLEIKGLKEKLAILDEKEKKKSYLLKNLQEEMDKTKMQYNSTMDEEKKRSEETEEKYQLMITVKEKRIATLEAHLSELSTMVGNYDKLRQQDQLCIQKLKSKVDHLHSENSTKIKSIDPDIKIQDLENRLKQLKDSPIQSEVNNYMSSNTNESPNEDSNEIVNPHARCELELLHAREEFDQYKIRAESALKEKYSKTSTLLYDLKSTKEIKELKSQITKLQEQLQTAKSQLKLGEEYHNKITTNLEKFIEELKVKHKQEVVHMELDNRAKIMELEHQIQKQRERTLSLLEEKEKEIGSLKNYFLPQYAKKEATSTQMVEDLEETPDSDQTDDTCFLPNSLIMSKKDGHILHYMQELSRKDIEISNLRHSRIQTESALRKLQQSTSLLEERYCHESESLKSRIKLLESSKSQDGTNVEYLKNVVLRFLKCNDPKTQRHMINAIATVLHFTSSELQEVKAFVKTL